jgi:Alpha/beta hydrolase domain
MPCSVRNSFLSLVVPSAPGAPDAPGARSAPEAPGARRVPEAAEALRGGRVPEAAEALRAGGVPEAAEALRAGGDPEAPDGPGAGHVHEAPDALRARRAPHAPGAPSASGARARRAAIALAAFVVLVPVASATAGDVAPFTVPLPAVIGPVPSTADNFGFGVEGFDVQPPVPDGYIIEEYFVSGTGNLYEFTPTGIQVVSPCPAAATSGCTAIPYTTRMLVKRPRRDRDFSGTVVVEPLNPTPGVDIDFVWDRSRDYFVANGDIFVGWTSKSVTVAALKRWSPARYAALRWDHLPVTPGDNNAANDGITFDIASQIGALVRSDRPGNPLRRLRVERVIESGFSQDGGFTFMHASIFHGLARRPGGGAVYDGYVPLGTSGIIHLNFGLTAAGGLADVDPRRKMQPRAAPVIHVITESEVFRGTLVPNGLVFRRPDSDARGDRYRLWEVPGASHLSNDEGGPVRELERDFAQIRKIPLADLPPIGCAHQAFVNGPTRGIPGVIAPGDFPFSYVQNAAFRALERWIDRDIAPPRSPLIEVTTAGGAPAIARDAFGNARGGLRTPFVDVPITTYVPTDSVAHVTPLSFICLVEGFTVPFPAPQLRTLYRDRADYVGRFALDAIRRVRDGFWLVPDAIQAIERAIRSDVP